MGIESWILGLFGHPTGVIPVKVVAIVIGIVICRLPDPLLAHNTFTVPHALIQLQSAYFGQVFHGGTDTAKGMGYMVFAAVDVYDGWRFHL